MLALAEGKSHSYDNGKREGIGVVHKNIEILIKEVVAYNDKAVLLKPGKLAKINNLKIENLFLNIESFAEKRKVQISVSKLENLLSIIKGILDLDIREPCFMLAGHGLTGIVES